MANFLRKFVKSKSRSKSPVKHYYQHPSSNYIAGYNGEPLINGNETIYCSPKLHDGLSSYTKKAQHIESNHLSPKMTERDLYDLNDFNRNEYSGDDLQQNGLLPREYAPHSPKQHHHQSRKYLELKDDKNSKKVIKTLGTRKMLSLPAQHYSTGSERVYSTLDHKPAIYDDILLEQYGQVKVKELLCNKCITKNFSHFIKFSL